MQTISWRPGVNMREFAYYTAERPFASFDATAFVPNLRESQVADASNLGVRLVRFFASHKDFSTSESIQRIESALKALDPHKLQAIVCLTDNLAESNFFIPGDDLFYRDGHLAPEYWRQRLYEQNYIPHITRIAEHFKDDGRIAFWELGNELAIHPANSNDEVAFLTFAEKASRVLQETSHHHVALGAINSRQLAADKGNWRAFTERLYGIESLTVVGVHFYAQDGEENNAGEDLAVAKSTGRPFYIGEVGIRWNTGDRPAYLAKKLEDWKSSGAFSVLFWQFDTFHAPNQFAQGVGISDELGVARRFPDFDAICQIIRNHASPNAEPIPPASAKPVPDPSKPREIDRIAALPMGRESGGEVTPITPPAKYMVLAEGDGLKIRKLPGTDLHNILGKLAAGDVVLATAAQDFGEYRWLYHEKLGQGGWSAEKRLDETQRYLRLEPDELPEKLSVLFVPDADDPPKIRINELPGRGRIVVLQPMANARVLQHYGNTRTAFQFYKDGEDWYNFSQFLHAGVDLVTARGGTLEVRAGVSGTVTQPGGAYKPRRVDVKTDDGYLLIYGHLHDEPPLLAPGSLVNPDTVLGTIALKEELKLHDLFFTPHLHFEVRFRGFIINPLPLMSESVRGLYDDRSTWDFCDEGGWSKWLTPYEQPVLELISVGQQKPKGPATLFPR